MLDRRCGMVVSLEVTADVLAARRRWRHRGRRRPAFAETPGPGQRSVWDFPRPPCLEAVHETLVVRTDDCVLARTRRGCRVLETAGAPTYYFPPEDVTRSSLQPTARRTSCEWKGVARHYASAGVDPAAWCLERTFPEFATIRGWFAFYPLRFACFVGSEQVTAQEGGYYGGWVTRDLCGPIKGVPGSGDW
jgi:uncharacterized protein (DUF427 family)